MKLLIGLLISLGAVQANASATIETVDLISASLLLTISSPTITTVAISGGYEREIVLREGPQFIVDNAVNGQEVAPAILAEQLNIVRSIKPDLAQYSDVELTAGILQFEQM